MKITITVLLSIFILSGCSKSPTIEEVVDACYAKMVKEIYGDMAIGITAEEEKTMKEMMLAEARKELEEDKSMNYLEKTLSECTKNQNEREKNKSKNDNQDQNLNVDEPYTDACLQEGIQDWIKETGKEPDEFEKGAIIKGCASEDWGN